jgi:hypothetical protein
MRPILALALVGGLMTAAAPASAFVAINGLRVEPTGAKSFYVPLSTLTSDHAFWCAAGDFVKHSLGLPGKTPIYRLSPPPRKRGKGIEFSLDPAGAADKTGVTIFGNSGPKNSVSATIAYGLCESVVLQFGGF